MTSTPCTPKRKSEILEALSVALAGRRAGIEGTPDDRAKVAQVFNNVEIPEGFEEKFKEAMGNRQPESTHRANFFTKRISNLTQQVLFGVANIVDGALRGIATVVVGIAQLIFGTLASVTSGYSAVEMQEYLNSLVHPHVQGFVNRMNGWAQSTREYFGE